MKAAEHLKGEVNLSAEEVASTLEGLDAGGRIKWLWETYGARAVASTSYGLQAAVMLDLISKNAPDMPVVFIDTGYLFPETYRYIEELNEKLKVNLKWYLPKQSAAQQEALYGKLWEQGEEGQQKYALLNKVEPMDRALKELGGDIWLSGVRRSQSRSRLGRPFAQQQKSTMKVYPILDWSVTQIENYFEEQGLPTHPLEAEGYVTMGDWHSTLPLSETMEAEATRFGGNKYECGLHEDSGNSDFQI